MNASEFKELVKYCNAWSDHIDTVVDKFLIYYAAHKEGLDPRIHNIDRKFRHITREWVPSYMRQIKSVWIANLIFREGGLLPKYLSHRKVMELTPKETSFLKICLKRPWQFSYARIIDNPHRDFYMMEDAFSDETYLLYSPGISTTLEDVGHEPRLWFFQTHHNGLCRQTYGPILWFLAFDADDIFFFASELDPEIKTNDDLMTSVQKDPMPYYTLLSYSKMPITISRDHEMRQLVAWDYLEQIPPTEKLKKYFEVGWNAGIYQLKNPELSQPPHFAKAYYIEEDQTIERHAMTEYGFNKLTALLQKADLDLKPDYDIGVVPTMLIAAGRILGREIVLNEFEDLFDDSPPKSPETQEELDKVNALIGLFLPYINERKKPDIARLAAEAGVSLQSAESIWEQVSTDLWNKLDGLGK